MVVLLSSGASGPHATIPDIRIPGLDFQSLLKFLSKVKVFQ